MVSPAPTRKLPTVIWGWLVPDAQVSRFATVAFLLRRNKLQRLDHTRIVSVRQMRPGLDAEQADIKRGAVAVW